MKLSTTTAAALNTIVTKTRDISIDGQALSDNIEILSTIGSAYVNNLDGQTVTAYPFDKFFSLNLAGVLSQNTDSTLEDEIYKQAKRRLKLASKVDSDRLQNSITKLLRGETRVPKADIADYQKYVKSAETSVREMVSSMGHSFDFEVENDKSLTNISLILVKALESYAPELELFSDLASNLVEEESEYVTAEAIQLVSELSKNDPKFDPAQLFENQLLSLLQQIEVRTSYLVNQDGIPIEFTLEQLIEALDIPDSGIQHFNYVLTVLSVVFHWSTILTMYHIGLDYNRILIGSMNIETIDLGDLSPVSEAMRTIQLNRRYMPLDEFTQKGSFMNFDSQLILSPSSTPFFLDLKSGHLQKTNVRLDLYAASYEASEALYGDSSNMVEGDELDAICFPLETDSTDGAILMNQFQNPLLVYSLLEIGLVITGLNSLSVSLIEEGGDK
jgi:hypothetical protein